MSQTFKSHVEAIEPGSADEAELMAATASADALLAYSQARGLDLSRQNAEKIAAARANLLADDDLEGVSGGVNKDGVSPLAMSQGSIGHFFRDVWNRLSA